MGRDLALLAALSLALLLWLGWQTREPQAPQHSFSAAGLLSESPEQFLKVTGPRPMHFPEDHAAHPGYRNEWWYFTGNLEGSDERPFGFQFTLFRFELDEGERPQSAWASPAVWMAHLAISDLQADQFHQAQRFSRGVMDLAGATEHRWWLGSWEVRLEEEGEFRLQMTAEDFGLDLELSSQRPIVLQGDAGYSRKGPEPGNASHYYSLTRLMARGELHSGGERHPVTGLAWLDREWGSSQLAPGIAGWDWFSLQLDDGRDLMVYQLRQDDGRPAPWSAGTVVDADGRSRPLDAARIVLTPTRYWRDASGHDWPVAWRVEIPEEGLDLAVVARRDQQRWTGAVSYWEGAVAVTDAQNGRSLGQGYMELSGYAD